MTRRSRFDAVAVALAVLLALAALVVGLRAGTAHQDVDEAVYRRTVLAMQDGRGYYPATRDALEAEYHHPPSQLRAIRPPALFLVLRWFPEAAWRWLAGLVYLATLLLAWRIGRPYGDWGGAISCGLVGVWMLAYSPYLYLHSEVWGAPLLLAAVLAARRDDDRSGAAALAAATLLRELYALGLVLGFLLRHGRGRRPWVVALAVVGAATTAHLLLAHGVLSAGGREAAFGNEHLTWAYVQRLVSPGRATFAYVLGPVALVLGGIGLVRARRVDPGAALAAPFVAVMIALTVWSTRVYWNATWAPLVAAFVPAAILPLGAPEEVESERAFATVDR